MLVFSELGGHVLGLKGFGLRLAALGLGLP